MFVHTHGPLGGPSATADLRFNSLQLGLIQPALKYLFDPLDHYVAEPVRHYLHLLGKSIKLID